MLVQCFQTMLAQHLEVLHKIVVTSVTHQEQHLNAIEGHMKSFVSEQDKVNYMTFFNSLIKVQDSEYWTCMLEMAI